MYAALPSAEFISIKPEWVQKLFHQVCWLDMSAALLVLASLPSNLLAVLPASPPTHVGEPTTTRNVPSVWGLKLICTWVGLVTATLTCCPPAAMAAREPNVCPLAPQPFCYI